MRHLLALFALAFALVACDDTATTAPADTIPGPPNAPRLEVTVLTGTKGAPVDSPTVKVQWWYKDSVHIYGSPIVGQSPYGYTANPSGGITYPIDFRYPESGSLSYKVPGCNNSDSAKVYIYAVPANKISNPKYDSVQVYCKAP